MNFGDDDAAADAPAYGDEVLCANWQPLALQVAEPVRQARATSLDGADAEALLDRVYRCQQA